MEVIEIKTLIDVTNTNIRRANQGTTLQHNQFRNWTTLLQCIGLRSIIEYDRDPTVEEININGLGFGTQYKGVHRVWTFYFRPDRTDAFSEHNNPVALLNHDLDKIPMITNLSETINVKQSVFELTDVSLKNTIVKSLN